MRGVGLGVPVGVAVAVAVAVAVGVGVGVGLGVETLTHCENSEVSTGSLEASSLVAVAVTTVCPKGSGNISGPKLALQFPSVVTFVEPRNAWPSPKPDGSQDWLEKNSSRYIELATLSRVPEIVTWPPSQSAVQFEPGGFQMRQRLF